MHPERLKPIVATVGIEHMGGRQTIEVGPGGNQYVYSSDLPENGGVITSLMDVYNNNIWLVEAIARAATDNHWPRVDVKAGNVGPGVNGGFQGTVKSPMNKGRAYRIPGIGLAGDWPGGWTQTYAQQDTEAGAHGFDKNYFVQQVAGLSQLAGEFMLVKPLVIDLGWGTLKSALVNLQDSAFVTPHEAGALRQTLVDQYGRSIQTRRGRRARERQEHARRSCGSCLCLGRDWRARRDQGVGGRPARQAHTYGLMLRPTNVPISRRRSSLATRP